MDEVWRPYYRLNGMYSLVLSRCAGQFLCVSWFAGNLSVTVYVQRKRFAKFVPRICRSDVRDVNSYI